MLSEEAISDDQRTVVCRTDEAACDDLDLKLSRLWLRIAIAGVFAGQGMVFSLALNMTPPPFGSTPYWVLHGGLIFSALVVMGFLGGPLFSSTWGMLRSRRLSIEGLFTLSLIGAFVGSVAGSVTGKGDVFYEIVSIVIAIYTFGRMLGERSQAKLIAESGQLREAFDHAQRISESGKAELVSIDDISLGDYVRVDPGMPFSVDGVIRKGVGYVRETSLTGEPLPVVRRTGDRVRAGTYSEDGSFEVEVSAGAGVRELDQILDVVESGTGEPSELQLQANQLMQYFLPLVAGVAILAALCWSVFGTWMDAVFNSMAVLLIACPCALGLATPVAIWQGLYRMARMGLVSRDGSLVDGLAEAKTVFFDKTGTLSESEMLLGEVLIRDDWQERREELFGAVCAIESRSSHPIARTLVRELDGAKVPEISNWRLVPGVGVAATIQISGQAICLQVGEPVVPEEDASLLELTRELKMENGKRVYISVDDAPVGILVLRERPRGSTASIWEGLEGLGVQSVVLTGDPDPDLELPDRLEVRKGLSASEKELIVRDSRERDESPCFVGDGINDTMAMSAASTSVSMGSGTGLAGSTATGQFLHDRIEALPDAIALSRSIHRRLRGNLVYAASYNAIGMALAAFGLLHPVAAACIMLISSFFVTIRALKV